jgi:hypothetical protein
LWSAATDIRTKYDHLGLEEEAVDRILAVSSGFAKLVERMRQKAEEEMYATLEWFKWLRYGE